MASQEVIRDLEDSSKAFKELVWPVVSEWCGGGPVIVVEAHTLADMQERPLIANTSNELINEMLTAYIGLDIYSGIDALQIAQNNNGMRGIASRVQFDDAWASFTIRKSRTTGGRTEYAKRKDAIDNKDRGWLYPHLTVQAYISSRHNGNLLYACMAKTEDIIDVIANGRCGYHFDNRINPSDGNQFYAVWADGLIEYCNDVKIHDELKVAKKPKRFQKEKDVA